MVQRKHWSPGTGPCSYEPMRMLNRFLLLEEAFVSSSVAEGEGGDGRSPLVLVGGGFPKLNEERAAWAAAKEGDRGCDSQREREENN